MNKESKHIMVLRFSAMGDVALLTPVIKSFVAAYPEHTITVVSRPKFSAFFFINENVKYFPADVDKTYAGIIGLIKLFIELRKQGPDLIIDLHDHLRSQLICFLFRLWGFPVARFNKGREEKRQLTRKENKIRKELPHTVDRYINAFLKAGFDFGIVNPPYIEVSSEAKGKLEDWLEKNELIKNESWIGLAPFAAHKSKIWPVENYFKLIESLLFQTKSKFFLFGGGDDEIAFFKKLKAQFPNNCIIVAGELTIVEELTLIKRLDKMLCVDSSNMHLAALVGTPSISIWGGTHPSTGFGPFGKGSNEIIQIGTGKLPCRPCSVYGKETCWRGDFACLNEISVERILTSL